MFKKIRGELVVWRDHFYYKTLRKTRPLTVHVESLHNNNVWNAVKRYIENGGNAVWFVLTPANYDYVVTETGVDMTRDRWEKTLLERYKWMKEHGQEIQLHTHLRIKMDFFGSPAQKRRFVEERVRAGAAWLRKNGFPVGKIVFGWWSYDDECVRIARKHGLKTKGRLENYFVHDYDFVDSKNL